MKVLADLSILGYIS